MSPALALLFALVQLCGAQEKSTPIVDLRVDAAYRQIEPSVGDEWAPTWGRDDVLYTGSDDGTNFGGIPQNAVAFGQLEGNDPNHLKGTTVSGMEEYREPRLVDLDSAAWRTLDSYDIDGVRYRFVSCHSSASSVGLCITTSIDGGQTWKLNSDREPPVFSGPKLTAASFIVYRRGIEPLLGDMGRFIYAASYVGIVNGEDNYIVGRVPRNKIQDAKPADWSFAQADGSWKDLQSASPQPNTLRMGPDGANWKFTNAYSVAGVLYAFITRCHMPWLAGDAKHRHIFRDSSVIKSLDKGRTWTRPPRANYSAPMFPGQRFGAPYFVWYGKDGAAEVDNADRYVYAVSNDGHFEGGDNYILARVRKDRLPELSAADWSFYKRGDGMEDSSWTAHLNDAVPILDNPGRSGMTGMTYIVGLRRYVMIVWHYNHLSFETAILNKDLGTVLEFFEAPKPWGPWTRFKSLETGRLGWYTPVIGQRFQTTSSATTVSGFLYTTGFTANPAGGLDPTLYKLNYLPITLSTRALDHSNPAYAGGK